MAFAASSIADQPATSRHTSRGPGRCPYRIIQRGPASQAREIALERSSEATWKLLWPRIIQLWRILVGRPERADAS